jgi:hypothetical protein
MNKKTVLAAAVVAWLSWAGAARIVAQEHDTAPPTEHAQAHGSAGAGAETDAYPHPVVPADSTWAGSVVIIVVGLFVAAAVIGPIVRANTPEEVPPAHSHDEPPGTSGHHGPAGTFAELPGHGHGH